MNMFIRHKDNTTEDKLCTPRKNKKSITRRQYEQRRITITFGPTVGILN